MILRLFLCLLLFTPLYGIKIAVCYLEKFRGETEFAFRLAKAAANLGWEAQLINTQSNKKIDDVDFIITLTNGKLIKSKAKNYLCVFDDRFIFDENKKFKTLFFDYDGLLFTLQDISIFEEKFRQRGLPLNHLEWYPTVQENSAKEVEPNHLAMTDCHWGNRKSQSKYTLLTNLLKRKTYFRVYGGMKSQNIWYKDPVPYDGQSLLDALSSEGVSLVLHSDVHLRLGIPSGRIFESAAASTVIICDSNPFVMKHFGDSVLYFDQSASGLKIFKQIDQHMQWIKLHPEEALMKAKSAYAIYREKFLLEDQLLKLAELHDRLTSGSQIE